MLARLSLASLVLVAACASSSPTPATPASSADPSTSPSAEPSSESAKDDGDKPAADTPKPTKRNDAVPQDHSLTHADCENLGKVFGEASRHDLMSEVSPKLSQKLRDQAEANIARAVESKEEAWIVSCQKNLVDKTVDEDTIKCAMKATTVKAFDVCLNGESPEPAPRPGKKK